MKFKIEDKVVLVSTTYIPCEHNPVKDSKFGCVGVIKDIIGDNEVAIVYWSSMLSNVYPCKHLQLVDNDYNSIW